MSVQAEINQNFTNKMQNGPKLRASFCTICRRTNRLSFHWYSSSVTQDISAAVGIACCNRIELEEYRAFISNFHPALHAHTISETVRVMGAVRIHVANGIQSSRYQ